MKDNPLSFIPKELKTAAAARVTTPIRSSTFKDRLGKKEDKIQVPVFETLSSSIGRMSPLKRPVEKEPVFSQTPPIDEIKTITSEHLSPMKFQNTEIEDEDDIIERANDLINDPTKIDYSLEHDEVKLKCTEIFKSKFQSLVLNYPNRGIAYPEGKSLNKIHDMYHGIIKSIYVNMNLGQIQLGYIIVLMAIEFVCVKAFNIPLAGFTKMELKRMHRYNQIMVEIGESLYSVGDSQWPIEWRILGTLTMNIVIFIALKFLAQYVGGESMTEVIRNAVDKVLDNPVTKDNIETGNAKPKETTSDGLGSMMEGMMGGNGSGGSGIADLITSLGTGFTQKMEKRPKSTVREKKRRFIFEE